MPGPYVTTRPTDDPGMVVATNEQGVEEVIPAQVAEDNLLAQPTAPMPDPMQPELTPAPMVSEFGEPLQTDMPAPEAPQQPTSVLPVPETALSDPGPDPNGAFPGLPAQTVPKTTEVTSQEFPAESVVDRQNRLMKASGTVEDAEVRAEEGRLRGVGAGLSAGQAAIQPRIDANQQAIAEATAHRAEEQKMLDAIESTPLDERGFWADTGRSVAAVFALAMSGFVQGVRGGENTALRILDTSLDRHIKNQIQQKNSAIQRRARAIGSLDAAVNSARMQLGGLLDKQMDLQMQQAGVSAQGNATIDAIRARNAAIRADGMNKLGAEVNNRAQQSIQSTQTKPVTPFEQRLQTMGQDLENWQNATSNATGKGDLITKINNSDRLKETAAALQALADANGGVLPGKEALTLDRVEFIRNFRARMGDDSSIAAISEDQLMNRALLALKQSIGNSKLVDSNTDAASVQMTFNTPLTDQTLQGVRELAKQAEQGVNQVASQYGRGREADLIALARERSERSRLGSSEVKERVVTPAGEQRHGTTELLSPEDAKVPEMIRRSPEEPPPPPPEMLKRPAEPVGAVEIPSTSRIASVHNNPGNLAYAGQEGAEKGEPKKGGGWWAKFDTPQEGWNALQRQIVRDADRGLTVAQFINKYAPPSENDTDNYLNNILEWVGAQPGDKLDDIPVDKLARAMAKQESGAHLRESGG
jgi:hypothetical protein